MQADGGGLGARERHDVELDAFCLVEAIGLDGIEQPTHGAELQHADLELLGGLGKLRHGDASDGKDQES